MYSITTAINTVICANIDTRRQFLPLSFAFRSRNQIVYRGNQQLCVPIVTPMLHYRLRGSLADVRCPLSYGSLLSAL
jgi:hypothetical protein